MHRAVSSPDQFPPSLHEIENFFLSQSMGHLRGFLMNFFALFEASTLLLADFCENPSGSQWL